MVRARSLSPPRSPSSGVGARGSDNRFGAVLPSGFARAGRPDVRWLRDRRGTARSGAMARTCPTRRSPGMFLVLLGLIWGGSFLAIEMALTGVGPLWIAAGAHRHRRGDPDRAGARDRRRAAARPRPASGGGSGCTASAWGCSRTPLPFSLLAWGAAAGELGLRRHHHGGGAAAGAAAGARLRAGRADDARARPRLRARLPRRRAAGRVTAPATRTARRWRGSPASPPPAATRSGRSSPGWRRRGRTSPSPPAGCWWRPRRSCRWRSLVEGWPAGAAGRGARGGRSTSGCFRRRSPR